MTKLYVITGHGGGDSGAVGFGYQEQERVRTLAKRMKELAPNDVTLGDMNRNYYEEKLILSLQLPKDTCIIELHMDSFRDSSAKGGHVIIKDSYQPDKYDKALAENISKVFPGRANSIVKTSNLRNVNHAAQRGFNYRLLEVCFISNQEDLSKFNNSIDEIAKAILSAFDIKIGSTSTPAPSTPAPSIPATPTPAKPTTQKNDWVARLQTECNKQGFSNQKVDGIPGTNTLNGCPTLSKGSKGAITKLLQERLKALGYNVGSIDGINGSQTQTAIKAFQRAKGLTVDGIVGKNTWRKLLGL